jgi:hypothetical protein
MPTSWQADQLSVSQGLQDFGVSADKPIAVDVSAALAQGESPTNLTAYLWQLGEDGAADVLYPAGLNSVPTANGTIVSQRISGLVGVGRIYKLVIYGGAVGNNRELANVALRVVE